MNYCNIFNVCIGGERKKREVKGLHTLVQLYPVTSTHWGKWVIFKKKNGSFYKLAFFYVHCLRTRSLFLNYHFYPYTRLIIIPGSLSLNTPRIIQLYEQCFNGISSVADKSSVTYNNIRCSIWQIITKYSKRLDRPYKQMLLYNILLLFIL